MGLHHVFQEDGKHTSLANFVCWPLASGFFLMLSLLPCKHQLGTHFYSSISITLEAKTDIHESTQRV